MRRIALVIAAAGFLALPATANAAMHYGARGPAVVALQRKLARLTFFPAHHASGYYGLRTEQAVMAFQGWNNLTRDGVAGGSTFAKLKNAKIPRPRTRAYRHVEVHLKAQVALLVANRKVIRTIHVSTGRTGLPTPAGSFRVYLKQRMSWSRPFQTWLPLASYFHGGYAFHQYPDVPGYPASHGCVRIAKGDASVMWYFATVGTPVLVR
jgi:peptidoglycan hydrolase-like protein with peptidoglycan-binding domain